MTDSELRHIYLEIHNGRGQHGSFLQAFAEAVVRADTINFVLLKSAMRALAAKYNLTDYLDNYQATLWR